MFVLRPIVAAMGACLLQACMTTPAARETPALSTPTSAPETTELAIQPVMRVRHSANQSAATFYQLGKYHLGHGSLDFARSAFEASVTLDDQQLDARNALAALDATQGRLDSAKALLIQIVADFPEVAHPYNNLGYVYYLQNDFEAAQKTLQRAIALDTGNERARNNLNAVNIALAQTGNLDTRALLTTQTQTIQPKQPTLQINEPVTISTETATNATTEARSQGLAIISPPIEKVVERIEHIAPQTRMELVEIVPNVFELKLKQAAATALASAVAAALATNSPAKSLATYPTTVSRIEVANGNGVTGMAKHISDVLNRQGISVSRLSNELPYKQQETKIQYRAGFEKTAVNLKNALKGHAVVAATPSSLLNVDVRLVLGKNTIARMALIEGMNNDSVLALNMLPD